MAKHRGEPEHEILEPGDIVKLRGSSGTHEFLILKGGYTVVGQWNMVVTEVPLTTRHFDKVDSLGEHGL